jgi:hypothetical protein
VRGASLHELKPENDSPTLYRAMPDRSSVAYAFALALVSFSGEVGGQQVMKASRTKEYWRIIYYWNEWQLDKVLRQYHKNISHVAGYSQPLHLNRLDLLMP